MSGDLMFVSFHSQYHKFTFTGDSQIAHVASDNPLSLEYCSKSDQTGDILIASQGACSFNYQSPSGYCSFTGNRLFIKGATTFGDPGDRYDVTIKSSTAGVYFGSAPTLYGFLPTDTDMCDPAPVGTKIPAAFHAYNEGGTANASYPGSTCSVTSSKRVP